MKQKILSLFTAITMLITALGAMPLTANAETTAASSIRMGSYVQMGEYNGAPILWRCVAFEKATGDIIDSTDTKLSYQDGYLPLMLADEAICYKEFDAKGGVTKGSHGRGSDRTQKGSSYWGDSNIRDWLNSAEDTVTYTCGNAPSYANEKGFLTNFNDAEKAAMKTVTQKSLLCESDYNAVKASGGAVDGSAAHTYNSFAMEVVKNYSDAYSEQVTDTMFLLDVRQINTVYNMWDTYYALSEYYSLRSPDTSYDNRLRVVMPNGEIGTSDAAITISNVRPAFFLNPSTAFVSGTGKKETPYVLPIPHKHDMSVECGQTDAVTFNHAFTSQDGKLYIDGAVLEPTVETSSTYTDLPDGNYYLAEDVTLANYMEIKGDVNLCLNGHTLDMGGNRIVITKTGNLSLCDCGEGGQITGAYNGASSIAALIETSGEFSMYGGSVMNTSADGLKNKKAVSAFAGTVRLYGGEVVSHNDSAVMIAFNTGSSLHLSGAPRIQTYDSNKADIYLNNDYSARIITLDAPLTITSPYRVAADGENVFTSGWNTHMSGKDFSDYFISATKGKFIAKDENNELKIYDYAVTAQPSAANSYTVTANGAPDYAPTSYKWYSAEVKTENVTDENAQMVAPPADGTITSSYDSETGSWTGANAYEGVFYFKISLNKGDVLKVKPSSANGIWDTVIEDDEHNYYVYVDTANDEGEYELTAKGSASYTFSLTGRFDTPPTVTAKVIRTVIGAEVTGQTAKQFTGNAKGTYVCKVTYADGTVLTSDVFNYVPVNYEFGIKYNNGKAVVTAKQNGTYTVIFASYDGDGKLLNFSAEDKTLQKGENDPIEPKQGFVSGEKVKVMLWDSLNGMKPLCAADGN